MGRTLSKGPPEQRSAGLCGATFDLHDVLESWAEGPHFEVQRATVEVIRRGTLRLGNGLGLAISLPAREEGGRITARRTVISP